MGLQVRLAAGVRSGPAAGTLAVRVDVAGGQGPVRVYAYLDGELAALGDGPAAAWELPAPGGGPRHALTVRAVDAAGRWGGSSVVVTLPPPGRVHRLEPAHRR